MADTYTQRQPLSPDEPAIGAVAISYGSGDQDLSTYRVRGVYIGTAGNLKVDMADGTTAVTFSNLAAGAIYPLKVTKVYQTGSSAAGLALI
jgi:hypothetical protein